MPLIAINCPEAFYIHSQKRSYLFFPYRLFFYYLCSRRIKSVPKSVTTYKHTWLLKADIIAMILREAENVMMGAHTCCLLFGKNIIK